VGRYCPALASLEEMDHEDILLQIEAARPDILLVVRQSQAGKMAGDASPSPACSGVYRSWRFARPAVRAIAAGSAVDARARPSDLAATKL
jgi:hypothetical protein